MWTMLSSNFRSMTSRGALFLFLGTTIGGSSFYFSSESKSRLRSQYNRGNNLIATSASNNNYADSAQIHKSPTGKRTYNTKEDQYFQKHEKIPLPSIMHDNLERLLSGGKGSRTNGRHNNRILVIGDVHGCLEELQNLVQKATRDHNNGQKFAAIILVGDLCNKGPSSAETIAYVRHQPRWFSIRGNHDDRALAAALGDEEARSKPKYAWVDALSDEDVNWMSELPYTITIPKSMLNVGNNAKDVIIVHAGLVPTTGLINQSTHTMVTIRNLIVEGESTAWAKLWEGPELVIFGHDAKRGLQNEEHAIGLDSGCLYGNKLTGIILPEREYVRVDAKREYCPIKRKA